MTKEWIYYAYKQHNMIHELLELVDRMMDQYSWVYDSIKDLDDRFIDDTDEVREYPEYERIMMTVDRANANVDRLEAQFRRIDEKYIEIDTEMNKKLRKELES